MEDGEINWVDEEPTPDPEEVVQEAFTHLNEKMDTILKQQGQILEMLAKMQKEEKPKAEGSKASKKKPTPKAKET